MMMMMLVVVVMMMTTTTSEELFQSWYRKYSQNTTHKVVEYLSLRQHVSALALGHNQVSNCASEETIQCGIRIAHIIQRDLVDSVTIGNCQEKQLKIFNARQGHIHVETCCLSNKYSTDLFVVF